MNATRSLLFCAAMSAAVLATGAFAVFDASPASAQASDGVSAKQKLREARKLTRQGELEAALTAVDEGLAVAPDNLDLLRLRGSILLERRDFEGALQAFEAFLAAGPRGAAKRKVERIVRDLEPVRTTFLEVTVDRGPAKIFIDSKLLGEVCIADPTCKRGMAPGKYRLYIVREGFAPVRKRIEIAEGQTLTVGETMAEQPSTLEIGAKPDGAMVTVDDAAPAPAPLSLEVAAGEHTVVIAAPGYERYETTVTAALGAPLKVLTILRRAIPVTVSVEGATLTLDGKPVQLVDGAVVLEDATVAHELVATAKDHEPATVVIPADAPLEFTATLDLVKVATAEPEPEPEVKPPPPVETPVARIQRRSKFEGGVFVGGMNAASDHEFYDARMGFYPELESTTLADVGLRAGYFPLRFLGVEAETAYVRASTNTGSGNLFAVRGHVVAQVPLGPVTGFGVAGLGLLSMRSSDGAFGNDTDATGQVGLGAKYRVAPRWSVRLDGRLNIAPSGQTVHGVAAHSELLVGASFSP